MDLAERLPEDVLAEVLRRLAPRWLAASRCVCRAWRDAVDSRGLLRRAADPLPRSVRGIFINNTTMTSWLLSRPSAGPAIHPDLRYIFPDGELPDDAFDVKGHCEGLLLLPGCVGNPATRQWRPLPPPPCTAAATGYYFYHDEYLAFDPAASLDYEVFSIPRVRRKVYYPANVPIWDVADSDITLKELDPRVEASEWPPSPCAIHVFSSRTGRWEERTFVRRGAAAGTVADVQIDEFTGQRYAVHRRGALYVHCQTDFIMRLSLSSGNYRIIQPPVAFEPESFSRPIRLPRTFSIGKSKEGLCGVLIDKNQIKIWILDESKGQEKWVSKQLGSSHLPNLRPHTLPLGVTEKDGPWKLYPIASLRRCRLERHCTTQV